MTAVAYWLVNTPDKEHFLSFPIHTHQVKITGMQVSGADHDMDRFRGAAASVTVTSHSDTCWKCFRVVPG